MIVNLFPLILLLVPGRAKESETSGPITVCDNIYPPASQSLLNLNCILQATVYLINTEILNLGQKLENGVLMFDVENIPFRSKNSKMSCLGQNIKFRLKNSKIG